MVEVAADRLLAAVAAGAMAEVAAGAAVGFGGCLIFSDTLSLADQAVVGVVLLLLLLPVVVATAINL